MKKKSLFSTLLIFLFFTSSAKAQTEKLDNIAACAGVIMGNGAVDFFLGDEQAFDDAITIGNSALFSEIFSVKYPEYDVKMADKILGSNLDMIVTAYNTQNFKTDEYEKVIRCYRILAKQLIERGETVIKNQTKWEKIKNSYKETLKRVLKAG